jgi:Immunity protein 21
VTKLNNGPFEYFVCDGGPHLVLPVALAASWAGVDPDAKDPLDPSTDYGRAYAVPAPIGRMVVGEGTALVLGHAPPISAWSESIEPGSVDLFVLDHWSVRDLDSLLDRTRAKPTASLRDTRIIWDVPEGGAYLMFAGDSGAHPVFEPLRIPLAAGRHSVLKGTLKAVEGTVSLFRLTRLG